MAVYDILQIVRHVTDTLAESHVYFSFLKVSSTVAELEVMSAKPWDFFWHRFALISLWSLGQALGFSLVRIPSQNLPSYAWLCKCPEDRCFDSCSSVT